jgi:hypothetical protein
MAKTKVLGIRIITVPVQPVGDNFSFTLATAGKKSAAVYVKNSPNKVRNLWSGEFFEAGTHVRKWDGLLDFGEVAPLPRSSYEIRVLSHDVKYEWLGVMGNSSTNQVGDDMHRPWDAYEGIRITGNRAYLCSGYGEGRAAQYYFELNTPQIRKDAINIQEGNNQKTEYLTTDGTYVYWAGFDPYNPNSTFVFATRVDNNEVVTFSSGTNIKMQEGTTFSSIGLRTDGVKISGVSVGTTYLFIPRKDANIIGVYNKLTGAFVRNIAITAPKQLWAEGSTIWVSSNDTITKRVLNSDGSLGSISLTLPAFNNVLDIYINGSTVGVVNGGSAGQQVKCYNTTTGVQTNSIGIAGGNINSPVVADNKFCFRKYVEGIRDAGSLAILNDGSYWVVDPGNFRMLHFSASNVLIEKVSYLGRTYNTLVDKNNPSRLIAGFLEYEVDYSAADIRQKAVLKYNWQESSDGVYATLKEFATLSNGRTYGVREDAYHIVELNTVSGLRNTGVVMDIPFGKMYPDGSIKSNYLFNDTTKVQTWISKPLLSFTAQHNPVYGTVQNVASVTVGDKDPKAGGPRQPLAGEVTQSGYLLSFQGGVSEFDKDSFRLGAIDVSTGQFLWRDARTTRIGYKGDYPTDGRFDIGNYNRRPASDPPENKPYSGNAGNVAMALGSNVMWGDYGEFRKGGQCNYYTHLHESGLYINTFGADRLSDYPLEGVAGNAVTPQLFEINGVMYLIHGDESVHGGIHLWRITGLNTIQIQTATSTALSVTSKGLDVLSGLVSGQTVVNGLLGITRFPLNDYGDGYTNPSALITVGEHSYDVAKSKDIWIKTLDPSVDAVETFSLGVNTNTPVWQLTSLISFENNEFHGGATGNLAGIYYDVIDSANKVIARFFITDNNLGTEQYQGLRITGNDKTIKQTVLADEAGRVRLLLQVRKHQPLSISANNGILSFKYANHAVQTTSTLSEAGANINNPTKLRVTCFINDGAPAYRKWINLKEVWFKK